MATDKQRRVTDEGRVFKEKNSGQGLLLLLLKSYAQCLICKEGLPVLNEYNSKRHYNTQ